MLNSDKLITKSTNFALSNYLLPIQPEFPHDQQGLGGATTHPSDPAQATHIQVAHTVANLYGRVLFQIKTEIGSRVAWVFYQSYVVACSFSKRLVF